MARFVYSLQSVLSIKEKMEEQEKNNYSQAVRRLQEEEEKLEECHRRCEQAEYDLKEVILSKLDIQLIKNKEDAVEILKMYEKQQRFIVFQREDEVERAREILNEAMKERKIYEKLREKAFDEFLIEENAKEQKEIDELVSYRFGNLRGDSENG